MSRVGTGPAAGVLLISLVISSVSIVSAQEPAPYGRAIEQYRQGDVGAALDTLARLAEDRTWTEANRIWRWPRTDVSQWLPDAQAALLLHTEAWFRGIQPASPRRPNLHVDCARTLVRLLIEVMNDRQKSDQAAEQDRIFIHDWYLLVVSQLHGEREIGRSRWYLAEALKLFPNDAAVLLAAGSDHEMLSAVAVGWVQYYDMAGQKVVQKRVAPEEELRNAIRYYRAAMALAPDVGEIRLRLGRSLYRLGEFEEAAQHLEVVRSRTPAMPLRYLADVFLGLAEVARGRRARARELYDHAMQLYPRGQAPYVALSELEYLEDRPVEAAAVMTGLLQTKHKDDPWWTYLLGEWWHIEARIKSLRERVRR